ncbi:hypothetical protein Y88_0680 [Novosphingobium nitrogenifigens DSM 19370]|uniref:TNase-like domain-containing protein n=1 Tax=Novosphingobium nitrogenifigens DSM 19370 TaxID=983920 RepID=F1Z9W9_9SPHN|nr:thermonuclease family protein [Novosphingobium nitrogenifigens]EGD58623.1 hypothetical protein Y88_0680 [Novosphingobium nitrogenifigens DSM 19370]
MPLFAAAALTACPAPAVHDGDTIRCGEERIRISDIDAPELPSSPKCAPDSYRRGWCDFALGRAARNALVAFLGRGPIVVRRIGVDRYGRTLALVSVNGVDAGEFLVQQHLARRWR